MAAQSVRVAAGLLGSRRAGLFPPLPAGTFDVIYADPPWDYEGQMQHTGPGGRGSGGAALHYPTVKLDVLRGLGVGGIAADDSLLFMCSSVVASRSRVGRATSASS